MEIGTNRLPRQHHSESSWECRKRWLGGGRIDDVIGRQPFGEGGYGNGATHKSSRIVLQQVILIQNGIFGDVSDKSLKEGRGTRWPTGFINRNKM